MPCLILTGLPCVGKTTLAEKIKERALQHSSGRVQSVLIVNEEMACPGHTKAQCYFNSHSEKKTRGALKSCFDQAVVGKTNAETKQQLVILDSMNYIKGFRYELFCISKAAGEQHGVIWALNSMELSKEWNTARNANDSFYSEKLMDELIQRYEPPDERNRWDRPLYKIDMRPQEMKQKADGEGEILGKSVYNMHALSDVMGKTTISSDTTSAAAGTNNNDDQQQDSNAAPKKKTFKGFKRAPKATKPVPANYVSPSVEEAAQVQSPPLRSDDNPVLFPKNFLFSSAPTESELNEETGSANADSSIPYPEQDLHHNRPPKKAQASTQPILDPNAPLEEQIDAILDSFLLHVQPLVQGQSTQQHVAGSANVLHEMDSITQSVCDAIVQGQIQTTVVGRIPIVLAASTTTSSPDQAKRQLFLDTSRRLPLAELRRLRKQYLRWVGTHPPEDCSSEYGIAKSFVTYIEAQL